MIKGNVVLQTVKVIINLIYAGLFVLILDASSFPFWDLVIWERIVVIGLCLFWLNAILWLIQEALSARHRD